ncbi:phosphoribosylanthranilate isomerase [Saccharicrinis aurantiacus]|uniref:phosphoribosylanthranilate isomerase n=1 Tax=Saccharicrinis aurantiacus TaxID=1849719 RepID=UPI001C9E5C28|nr:phosphoribosylanthranilate isomerase [Saccharicrinis aurantiacus]
MSQSIQIKVCGMRDSDNIKAVAALGPDYLGFIFYGKSPRFVEGIIDVELLNQLPNIITKTGVFVNAEFSYIKSCVNKYGLDAVQLHGNESPEFCASIQSLGLETIKAFQVSEEFDFSILDPYALCTDYFLFDTKTKTYGGSGHKFNWELLKQYNNQKPLFLSGGIDVDDASDILKLKDVNIHAVDINSRFEIEPALKSVEKVKQFIQKIKNQ